MSAFRLVKFVAAHLPEATDLWVEAWTKSMPQIDFEARRAWIVDRLVALEGEGAEIVCAFGKDDGRMAGFVTVLCESGHIDQLVTGVHAWGSGAAVALLDEAKRLGGARVWLDVNQDNPRAVRFYEREGLVCEGEAINPASGLRTWRYAWRERS